MPDVVVRKAWTIEDKDRLVLLTKRYTNSEKQIMWDEVAEKFSGRTKLQLKTFFFNNIKQKLDPNDFKQNKAWNVRDDEQLHALVAEHGHRWKEIAKAMPQYDSQQIKLRYFYLEKAGYVGQKQEASASNAETVNQLIMQINQLYDLNIKNPKNE